jgi:SAM-dependent methyltransferase
MNVPDKEIKVNAVRERDVTATGSAKPVTPERIMGMAWAYAAPLMLEAGVRLRVFDVLDGGAKTVAEVAAETGASQRGLRILMNGLVGLELLAKDGEAYELTPESAAFLVSTKPSFQGGLLKHVSSQLVPKWLNLTENVRTGKASKAVNQEGPGSAFFESFVEDIFPMSYGAARVLADTLKPGAGGPLSVLDVAAGSGVWGIAAAERWPEARVTAVDWPGVLPVTRRVAERHGVADRFRYVAGDLKDADFGAGHHLAALGHILHSEGPDRSWALLRKVFASLAPGGTVAIAEFVADEDRAGPPGALIFAVNMLVNTDQGDSFTYGEISAWLREAGFVNVRQLPAPGPSPLILADRPGA